MSESLPKLLLRRSEAGRGAALWGREAQPQFGRAFDRLLADRVLTERAPATTWPPCRTCDAGCGPRAIAEIDGRFVAECPEDHACDTVLAPHEVRSFAIDPEALVRLIAAATGLPGTPFLVTEGAWMLGRTPTTGRAIVLVLDPVAGRDPDLVALVRAEAPVGCPVTVLLPSGMEHADMRQLTTAGFHAIPALDALAGAAGPAFALDGASLEPTPAREPKVILRAGARSIVLFGRTVKLSERRFLVAQAIAAAASRRAIASRRDIERALYGNRSVDDRLVADAVRDLREAIAPALPDGIAPADFVQTRSNQGYALGVEHDLIRLDP